MEKQAVTIKPSADRKRVVSVLIPSALNNYPLTLTWGNRTLHPILEERRSRAEQAVHMTFRTAGGLVKASLHQSAAAVLLPQVRAGSADIVSIHVPQGVVGTLNIREGTLAWTEMARLEGVGSASALNAEQLAVLTKWLRKQAVDVRVSFECFGEFSAGGIVVPTHTTLSKNLRDRLEWYLRLTGQGLAQYGIASLSDAEIVKAVSAPNQNPIVAARQNLLLNELKISMDVARER
jgi:hypothetical protein